MLSGMGTDEIENSARLPLPVGERVGVRGQKGLNNTDTYPLTRPLRGRPLPAGERGGASRTASHVPPCPVKTWMPGTKTGHNEEKTEAI